MAQHYLSRSFRIGPEFGVHESLLEVKFIIFPFKSKSILREEIMSPDESIFIGLQVWPISSILCSLMSNFTFDSLVLIDLSWPGTFLKLFRFSLPFLINSLCKETILSSATWSSSLKIEYSMRYYVPWILENTIKFYWLV